MLPPTRFTTYEHRLIRKLTAVGVTDAAPAERTFKSAMVAGELDGTLVVASTLRAGIATDARPVETHRAGGVDVQVVQLPPVPAP